jgi:hypothetical protein
MIHHNPDSSPKPNRSGKPRLDDAETIILMAAANRDDGVAFPVPDRISAPPEQIARKIKRLIKLSLLQEIPAKLEDGLWRKSTDDRHLTLKITPLTFKVLGLSDGPTPAGNKQPEIAGDSAIATVLPLPRTPPKHPRPRSRRRKLRRRSLRRFRGSPRIGPGNADPQKPRQSSRFWRGQKAPPLMKS